MFDERLPPDAMRRSHQNGMYQRTNSFSTADPADHEEIDLMEILQEIPPDDHSFESPQRHSHGHPPPSNINRASNVNNDNGSSNENTFILIIKGIFAFIFGGLQKLHVTSRTVHQFLIFQFLLTSIGLTKYLELSPHKIIENGHYWRLITCSFTDSSVFLALLGCITLGDIVKRMEYYFGSLWTLYLVLFNWISLPLLTFFCQSLLISNLPNSPSFITNNGCIGVYPLIFSLSVIESLL